MVSAGMDWIVATADRNVMDLLATGSDLDQVVDAAMQAIPDPSVRRIQSEL
jgi:hypothetical protein